MWHKQTQQIVLFNYEMYQPNYWHIIHDQIKVKTNSFVCQGLTEISQSHVVPKIVRSPFIWNTRCDLFKHFSANTIVIDEVCGTPIHIAILGKMHPPSASFLGGLRMYKIVLLGEGGVGKSGQLYYYVPLQRYADSSPNQRNSRANILQTSILGNDFDLFTGIASWMSLPSDQKFQW